MRTIAIINQKGGCGKTTTAINLAAFLAQGGRRTLLVDLDPQSHCAAGLSIPEQRIEVQIGDAILADPAHPIDLRRMVWRVGKNLDLAPSTMKLAMVEAARSELAGAPDAERRLGDVLATLGNDYDACLLDCPPSIGVLTFNALAAADLVLIPVETGYFALQGATRQWTMVQSLSSRLGRTVACVILPTLHDPSNATACDVLDELHRRFSGSVCPAVIRYDAALREATSFGQPVSEYAPHSVGAQDYGQLSEWLLTLPAPIAGAEGSPSGSPPVALEEAEAAEDHAAIGVDLHLVGVSRAQDLVARAMRRHVTTAPRESFEGISGP